MDSTAVFLLQNRNEELAKQGFCRFQLLPNSAVQQIRNLYFNAPKKLAEAFCTADKLMPWDDYLQLTTQVRDLILPFYHQHFPNDVIYEGSAFVIKPPGEKGIVWPHQDGSMVDERIHHGFSFWIALEDMHLSNGCLLILPKSHLSFPTFRGPNIPYYFEQVTQQLMPFMKPLRMKAGEAVIYYNRSIHASTQNQTNHERLALISGLRKENVPARIFYRLNENRVAMYDLPVSERYRYTTQGADLQADGLQEIDSFPYNSNQIASLELQKMLPKIWSPNWYNRWKLKRFTGL